MRNINLDELMELVEDHSIFFLDTSFFGKEHRLLNTLFDNRDPVQLNDFQDVLRSENLAWNNQLQKVVLNPRARCTPNVLEELQKYQKGIADCLSYHSHSRSKYRKEKNRDSARKDRRDHQRDNESRGDEGKVQLNTLWRNIGRVVNSIRVYPSCADEDHYHRRQYARDYQMIQIMLSYLRDHPGRSVGMITEDDNLRNALRHSLENPLTNYLEGSITIYNCENSRTRDHRRLITCEFSRPLDPKTEFAFHRKFSYVSE